MNLKDNLDISKDTNLEYFIQLPLYHETIEISKVVERGNQSVETIEKSQEDSIHKKHHLKKLKNKDSWDSRNIPGLTPPTLEYSSNVALKNVNQFSIDHINIEDN